MRLLKLAPFFVSPFLVAGCWFLDFGNSRPSDAGPPTLSNAGVEPTTLRFVGGAVTFTVDASDADGVSAVQAVVTKPDASTETVTMANASGNTYSAVWTAPGNSRVDGEAMTYTIRMTARDAKGNESSSDPLTLTVTAAPPPPAGAPDF